MLGLIVKTLKIEKMKWLNLLTIFLVLSCNQQVKRLSNEEIEQIKSDIIERSNKHGNDLVNLDYKSVMTFYSEEDFIIFGDGYYWGDYLTEDGLWRDMLKEGGWEKVLKWDLKNHKIHVFSREVASYLVEFDLEYVKAKGDTSQVSGCYSYGMKKIDGEWKAATLHVSHISQRTDVDKWWTKYTPSKRNK